MTTDDRPWVEWNPSVPGERPAKGARIRHEYGYNTDLGRYFVHPDDAPDPDAAIAERVRAIVNDPTQYPSHDGAYLRAIIAAVRQSDSGVEHDGTCRHD